MDELSTGTIRIHNRIYKTVALRVQEFREAHPLATGWSLLSEIIALDDDKVIMRASVTSPDGKVVGTGYAEEYRSASKINATSALENCETSALGRALAACGYGGSEYASANEVVGAITAQDETAEILKRHNEMVRNWLDTIAAVKTYIGTGQLEQAIEAWLEVPDDDKRVLWVAPSKGGMFTTAEREVMKGHEWAELRRAMAKGEPE